MPSAKSSSAKPTATKGTRRGIARDRADSPESLDQDALDAIDFAKRGRPDSEIGYSDDAPRLSEGQLAEFKPASIQFLKKR